MPLYSLTNNSLSFLLFPVQPVVTGRQRGKTDKGQATGWQAFIREKSLRRKHLIYGFLVHFYSFSESQSQSIFTPMMVKWFLFSVSTTLGISHLPGYFHHSWFEVISHCESLFKNLFLFVCMWTFLVSVWVYVKCTWVWVNTEARRRHCIPWIWRYRQLQATQFVAPVVWKSSKCSSHLSHLSSSLWILFVFLQELR